MVLAAPSTTDHPAPSTVDQIPSLQIDDTPPHAPIPAPAAPSQNNIINTGFDSSLPDTATSARVAGNGSDRATPSPGEERCGHPPTTAPLGRKLVHRFLPVGDESRIIFEGRGCCTSRVTARIWPSLPSIGIQPLRPGFCPVARTLSMTWHSILRYRWGIVSSYLPVGLAWYWTFRG